MKKILLPLLLISLFSCEKDLDDEAIQALLTGTNSEYSNIETIAKEDKLYGYLGLVSKDSETNLMDVGCIEFIYPFVLFQFDDKDNYIRQVSVQGNENFAETLANLAEDYSIGLSYPISGNLIDGTPVTVNSNKELQKSLESCIEEELEIIIGNCNDIVISETCIWKVTFSDFEESPYIDSFFTLREDGSVVLSVLKNNEQQENEEEQEYNLEVGTWIFYFIGSDLHMNINFGPIDENEEEISENNLIKSDWNFDWKINHIDSDKIEIEKTAIKILETETGEIEQTFMENITLEKECEIEGLPETQQYEVGSKGEAGGIIVYDKGEYINGWRFIEIASEDIITEIEWGCYNTPILEARNTEVGMGKTNTEAILAFHDTLNDFYNNPAICSEISNGTVAANEASNYQQNGFDDWFLPSEKESLLMYTELHLKGLGDFNTELLYWTSTEHDDNTATTMDFSNGDQGWNCKQCGYDSGIRTIRYF